MTRRRTNLNYRRYRKDYCEECGIRGGGYDRDEDGFLLRRNNNHLTAHHIDHNPNNNKKSNIQTLCNHCHKNKHNHRPDLTT